MQGDKFSGQDIAVLIPCYNEEATVAKVVADFQKALPDAQIYVYDNNSTDQTAERALSSGAVVRQEPLQGKGNVVRRMFADIEADIYVMVDGDDTYDAPSAPEMIRRLVADQLDMVNAARTTQEKEAYRAGHRLGNKVLTGIVGMIFGDRIGDMLSGFRVFSRRFVKSFPAHAAGFETETELTIHALELRMPIAEVATPYGSRPEDSESKLSTYRDGIRILWTIMRLVKEEKPFAFFSTLAAVLAIGALGTAWPKILLPYMETGEVTRLPTAILLTGMMVLSFLSFASGLILDTVTRGRKEAKRLHYLSLRAPSDQADGS
jgi:glycosyltransferase involved in cell wall biosynthesis